MVDGQSNAQLATAGDAVVVDPEVSGTAAVSNSSENIWDEQRIEDSLKILKEMYIQLRGLRTTIPRLIAPLTAKQSSPETLFHEFSTSAATANQEVQQFRHLLNSEESVKVLEQAKKSRVENPSDIKPWKITEHPDWLKRNIK